MAVRKVSPTVAAELMKADLPNEAIACLAALSSGEISPSEGFATEVGGGTYTGSLDSFPQWAGWGNPISHAVGAWQDEPATWGDVVAANPGITFQPQDQIKGNWWLAQRDFKNHTGGGDLLAALQAGEISQVATALFATWPGGANSDFVDTYNSIIHVAPPSSMPSVSLSPGAPPLLVPLRGYDRNGQTEPLPATGGVLTVDDPTIIDVVLSAIGQGVTITEKASGTTQVHYSLVVGGATLTANLQVVVMTLAKIAFVPNP